MSGIGGILNLDGAPVDAELLERVRDIIAHRGPDGSGIWVNRNVGLVHRLLWNTKESVHENQPMTNGRGFWVTADCRIDNREELESVFRSRGIWRETERLFDPFYPPDVAFILLAYEAWGEGAPNHLMGDFSFAIWDELNQKLFCARDPIGLKPFVYHWGGEKFIFGSEIKQLFQDRRVPRNLNQVHLTEFLIENPSNREETPYESIRRLPPAYSIRIQKGNFEIKRYWHWDPDSEPLSKVSIEENGEIFRHLFQEAIRARLRVHSQFRVGSLLSGGLDSSAIVSIAASIQNSLPVFTLYFPEVNPDDRFKNFDAVDEGPYCEAVIQKYKLEAHRIEIRGLGPFENLEENLWHQETPSSIPNLAYFSHLLKRARSDAGVRALFHGEGGDEVFMVGSQCFLRRLKRGDVSEFFSEWLARRKRRGASLFGLLNPIFRYYTPQWLKTLYRRHVRRVIPDWIEPGWAKKIHLRERVEREFRWDPYVHASCSYGILNWLRAGHIPVYLETLDRASNCCQLEVRLPYLDLRLLRFAAQLPLEQKVSKGVTKVLLREALKESLPSLIRERLRKAEFTPLIRQGMKKYASLPMIGALRNPYPLLRSIIVTKKLRTLYKNCLHPERKGPQTQESLSFLWHFVSLDQWLKYQESFWKRMEEVSYERGTNQVFSRQEA